MTANQASDRQLLQDWLLFLKEQRLFQQGRWLEILRQHREYISSLMSLALLGHQVQRDLHSTSELTRRSVGKRIAHIHCEFGARVIPNLLDSNQTDVGFLVGNLNGWLAFKGVECTVVGPWHFEWLQGPWMMPHKWRPTGLFFKDQEMSLGADVVLLHFLSTQLSVLASESSAEMDRRVYSACAALASALALEIDYVHLHGFAMPTEAYVHMLEVPLAGIGIGMSVV